MSRDKFAAHRPKVFELSEYVDFFDAAVSNDWIFSYGKVVGSATMIQNGQIINLVLIQKKHGMQELVAIHPDCLRIREV